MTYLRPWKKEFHETADVEHTLDGSVTLIKSAHIEMVWGDVHQLLVTGVESLQQHGVSSFTVQTDPALRVPHWK